MANPAIDAAPKKESKTDKNETATETPISELEKRLTDMTAQIEEMKKLIQKQQNEMNRYERLFSQLPYLFSCSKIDFIYSNQNVIDWLPYLQNKANLNLYDVHYYRSICGKNAETLQLLSKIHTIDPNTFQIFNDDPELNIEALKKVQLTPELATNLAPTAVQWNDRRTLEALVQRGASLSKVHPYYILNELKKKNFEFTDYLFKYGADINEYVENGTFLHHFCKENNTELIKYLVKHGANLALCDGNRKTPFDYLPQSTIAQLFN